MTAKDEKTFGVFLHSSGPQGGYVVRTMYDGWCPSPYNHAAPVATYKRESAAQANADKRNGVILRTHAENVKAYNVAGECSVRVINWPYECAAKTQNPGATVYICDEHRVWWFEA